MLSSVYRIYCGIISHWRILFVKRNKRYQKPENIIIKSENTTDDIARFLALVGILISICGLFIQWVNYKESRPNLRIITTSYPRSYFCLNTRYNNDNSIYKAAVFCKIINQSTQPISIHGFSLVDEKASKHYSQTPIPALLTIPKARLYINSSNYYLFSTEGIDKIPTVITLGASESKQGYIIFDYFSPDNNSLVAGKYFDTNTKYAEITVTAYTTGGDFCSDPLNIPYADIEEEI